MITTPPQPYPDSPGVPASAAAQQLFRGFSFVAPTIDHEKEQKAAAASDDLVKNAPIPGQRDYSGTALLTNRVCRDIDQHL